MMMTKIREDGNSVNKDDTSKELVTNKKTNYNICNDKTQEASTPAPVVVPESMPAIDVVPKN